MGVLLIMSNAYLFPKTYHPQCGNVFVGLVAIDQTAARINATPMKNAAMDSVSVGMVLIGGVVRVVDHACHMKFIVMADVSASMDSMHGLEIVGDAGQIKNTAMDNVCVSMETIGRAKDVVDHACHMKNFAMENVSASMGLIREDVVFVHLSVKVKVVV